MARPTVAHRPTTPRSERPALTGPLAWIPELLAIGGLVAIVALLVSALA